MDPREGVKEVKRHLGRVREIQRAVREARQEAEGRSHREVGMPGGTRLSDSTSSQALKRMEPLHYVLLSDGTMIADPEGWIEVYQATVHFFSGTEGGQILQLRLVEGRSVEWSLIEIGCLCRKTLFSIQDQVVHFALGVAQGLGVLEKQKELGNRHKKVDPKTKLKKIS